MTRERYGDERGAILIHVAIAMLGLLAFSAFVVDYGVLWASRRQAQNVADAAALAGAASLAFDAPGDWDRARLSAKAVGEAHAIFGVAPNIDQGNGFSDDITQDISFPECPPGSGGGTCVRVNVHRDSSGSPLPTFFARLFGRLTQDVRASATAQVATGNQIQCLLPFAVIDRWADNYDENKDTRFYPNDALPGVEGWSPNDRYQPDKDDVYIAPYEGNTDHTGWTVDGDYGRQLIIKDGNIGDYSTGWAQLVYLPGSQGTNDIANDIWTCNESPVGIADKDLPCGKNEDRNEAAGCVAVKPGMAQRIAHEIKDYVSTVDPQARWDWNAPGPDGKSGAVVGGQGMSSPRIRPIVIFDINTYIESGCTGGTCRGKVANIIGFFVEGVCGDVAAAGQLDPGSQCENPSKDIVGRIVKLPSTVFGGAGNVEESAAFLQVIRLVR